MATPEEVQKLAELARLQVSPERLPQLVQEFDQILGYVSQLNDLQVSDGAPLLPYENIMRKDGEPHERGVWTKALVEQFPERDGDSLSVKQIISHD